MTSQTTDPLEVVIRQAGEGWLIDWFAPRDKAIGHIKEVLLKLDRFSTQSRGNGAPRFTPDTLIREFERHPTAVTAFFQALGATRSEQMLLMAWRIIQGMEIAEVEVVYKLKKTFVMRVFLVSPYGDDDETYESNNIDDAALLRHFGIMTLDGKPVFDGFFAVQH